MPFRRIPAIILVLALLVSSLPIVSAAGPSSVSGSLAPDSANGMLFIQNVGQFSDEALFQIPGGSMWLTKDSIWLSAETGKSAASENCVNLRLSFTDANPNPIIEPFGREDTIVNYYLGSDESEWRTNVPVWSGVRYLELYPGVDLELSGSGGRLAWRWVTSDTRNLDSIKLRVEGGDSLAVDSGSLIVNAAAGPVTLALPQASGATTQPQVIGNEVSAPYAAENAGEDYHDLAAGSGLQYSTFLGGSGGDYGLAIGVDDAGSAYITGKTESSDFPTTVGPAIQGIDTFVAKLYSDGSGLDYATFIGGSSYDWGRSIAVAADGTVFIAGSTGSSDFPTTANAYSQAARKIFIAKLDPSGSLTYGTYLGGTGWDGWYALAAAAKDNEVIYVTGNAESSDFPTTPTAYRSTRNGTANDAFVTKINTVNTGTNGLLYSTYFGGSLTEYPYGIAVGPDGSVYITGQTYSDTDFPLTAGAYDQTYKGSYYGEGFVTKFSQPITGSLTLDYSTYLGGTGLSRGNGIAVDSEGSAYVTGHTETSDFPFTAGAPDTSLDGVRDAFVTKLNPTGSDLVYSTYLGGWGSDYGKGLVVDDTGAAYLAGNTNSGDFPVTGNAFDGTLNGGYDVFVTKMSPDGMTLAYSTYIGGGNGESDPNVEAAVGIDIDSNGAMYIGGSTQSHNWPTSAGGYDTALGGTADAFAAKLSIPSAVISPNGGEEIWAGSTYTVSWTTFLNSEAYRLQYSTDDGQNWDTISDTVTDTTYLWDIPHQNGNKTGCLVKVTGLGPGGVELDSDNSDNPFTIKTLALTSPNDASISLTAGDLYDIVWEHHGLADPVAEVVLQLSVDGGSSYGPLATILEPEHLADGSHHYSWTVPPIQQDFTDSRVRVILKDAAGNELATDESSNSFTMLPLPVTETALSYPNGGEEIWAGTEQTINWSAPPEAENFKLQLSTDNGATWATIAKDLTGNSYSWATPTQNQNRKQCKVRLSAYTAGGALVGTDTSDDTFSILALRLDYPSEAKITLTACESYAIKWQNGALKTPPAKVKIDYTTDGGLTWRPVVVLTDVKARGSGSHEYMWQVPNQPVDKTICKVKVTLLSSSGVAVASDKSLNNFTIEARPLTVDNPNGGEEIWAGSDFWINWTPPRVAEKFKLQYSTDNGATWKFIASEVIGTSHKWSLPTQDGNKTQCLVRVTGYNSSNAVVASDVSDGVFTMQSLKMTTPDDATPPLTAGQDYTINWRIEGLKSTPAKLKLTFSKDNGVTWLPIPGGTITDQAVIDGGILHWTVPNIGAKAKTKCRVMVKLLDSAGVVIAKDMSDEPFTINPVL